jgi:uncharacterized membrane protein
MTHARKYALIASSVWLAILVFFAVAIGRAGVEALAGPGHRGLRALLAAVILPGYVVNGVLLYRSRRARHDAELDERDEAIGRRASEATLIVLAVVIYAVSIALFELHRDAGAVPVGWFYIFAYGCMVVVSLTHPLATLALDLRGKVDA